MPSPTTQFIIQPPHGITAETWKPMKAIFELANTSNPIGTLASLYFAGKKVIAIPEVYTLVEYKELIEDGTISGANNILATAKLLSRGRFIKFESELGAHPGIVSLTNRARSAFKGIALAWEATFRAAGQIYRPMDIRTMYLAGNLFFRPVSANRELVAALHTLTKNYAAESFNFETILRVSGPDLKQPYLKSLRFIPALLDSYVEIDCTASDRPWFRLTERGTLLGHALEVVEKIERKLTSG